MWPGSAAKIRCNRWDYTDGNRSADRRFPFDDIASRGFQIAQNRSRMRKKRLPEFGELYPAAKTIKEPRTEFVFQFSNLL
jgi:hypothetical protein